MTATTFLEHNNALFSKILLSPEVAELKQIVRESSTVIHQNCNDREKNKGVCHV